MSFCKPPSILVLCSQHVDDHSTFEAWSLVVDPAVVDIGSSSSDGEPS